jgi:hypothetical protein
MTKAEIKDILRIGRIAASLEAKGVNVTFPRKAHYFNMRFDCYGRLQDGKVRYSTRWEVAGNTYPIKEILKGAGFRWDRGEKCWHSKDGWTTELGATILRALAS